MFKQGNVVLKDVGASIYVYDISKSGIGFISDVSLPLGYYFKGLINLGDGDFFRVVMHIIRSSMSSEEDYYIYGAEFIGLAPFLEDKVDKYEKKLKKENE